MIHKKTCQSEVIQSPRVKAARAIFSGVGADDGADNRQPRFAKPKNFGSLDSNDLKRAKCSKSTKSSGPNAPADRGPARDWVRRCKPPGYPPYWASAFSLARAHVGETDIPRKTSPPPATKSKGLIPGSPMLAAKRSASTTIRASRWPSCWRSRSRSRKTPVLSLAPSSPTKSALEVKQTPKVCIVVSNRFCASECLLLGVKRKSISDG